MIEERLAILDKIRIGNGGHNDQAKKKVPDEACAMELVAWLEGEPWSDHPKCACPSLTSMVIRFNDRCGHGAAADERRARHIRPLVRERVLVGTRGSNELRRRRAWAALDWSVRFATPRLLRLTSLASWADKLEALSAVDSADSLREAQQTLLSLRNEAWAVRDGIWRELRKKYAAVEAAAAEAVAVAVEAAVAGLKPIYEAAQKAHEAGGDWSACYWAARKVAAPMFAGKIRPQFAALRDELDTEFVLLIRRLAAMTEAA